MKHTTIGISVLVIGFMIISLLPLSLGQVETEYNQYLGDYVGITPTYITGNDGGLISTTDLVFSLDMETFDSGTPNLSNLAGGDSGTPFGDVPDNRTGYFGNATHFDGTGDYFDFGNGGLYNDSFTGLTIWIVFDSDTTTKTIFSRGQNNVDGWVEVLTNSGGIQFGIETDGGSSDCSILDVGVGASDGERHTVLAQWSDAEDTCSLWFDGSLIGVDTSVIGGMSSDDEHWIVGARNVSVIPHDGLIDELLMWHRNISAVERNTLHSIDVDTYTLRFDSETIVPPDFTNASNYVSGLNTTWGTRSFYPDNPDFQFASNVSVWFEGSGDVTDKALSWDSWTNITNFDVGFNFTLPSGTYPYWVNNTHQANLTTVSGAISWNWTDWLDGEHLFELGIEFTSNPITVGEIGIGYSYQAIVTKTSITGWNLTTGPGWGSISSGGLITGIPTSPGTFLFVAQANATGGVTVSQTFSVIVPAIPIPPSLTNTGILFMIGFIPFLLMVGIGFWKEQGALIVVGGIIGVLLGLWVIFALQDWGNTQFFGVVFLGIGILFSYVGWVNIERL